MTDLIGNICWAGCALLYLATQTPVGLLLGLLAGLAVGVCL